MRGEGCQESLRNRGQYQVLRVKKDFYWMRVVPSAHLVRYRDFSPRSLQLHMSRLTRNAQR